MSGGAPQPGFAAGSGAQIEHRFSFTFICQWVPRDLDVRADFMSHASAAVTRRCGTLISTGSGDRILSPGSPRPATPSRYAPRTRDASAHRSSRATRKPSGWTPSPSHGPGCSRLPVSWAPRRVGALTSLRRARYAHLSGCPLGPSLRCGAGWARDERRVVPLRLLTAVLDISRRDLRLLGDGPVIAIRFDRS